MAAVAAVAAAGDPLILTALETMAEMVRGTRIATPMANRGAIVLQAWAAAVMAGTVVAVAVAVADTVEAVQVASAAAELLVVSEA